MSETSETAQFESIIGADLYAQIKNLFNKITPQGANGTNSEFEFMFYNFNGVLMSYEKFLLIMKYIRQRSQKQNLPLKVIDTLDIVYNERIQDKNQGETALDKDAEMEQTDNSINSDQKLIPVLAELTEGTINKSFRITVEGMTNINKYMKMLHRKRNHVILSVLASMINDGSKELEGMIKTKDSENIVDINDLNMRIRLSEEKTMTKNDLKELININRDNILNISFRLKQRITLYVVGDENSESFVKIDLTITNTTKNINKIETSIPRYELEIECGMNKTKNKKDIDLLNKMIYESMILLRILQQGNHIITTATSEKVISEYARILSLTKENLTSLDARQSFSLEIQHLTEILPNKYAVTDKADGDRHVLVIVDNHAYFISTNLVVKDTGIDVPANMSEYNDTILDGELIFLPKKNRHIFMIFDCLFSGKTDVRKMIKIMDRLDFADKVVADCFVLKKQKNYEFVDYTPNKKEFDLNDIVKFHEEQIGIYMKALNDAIDIEKQFPLIRRKYFIDALGAKSWEIFAYATMMYQQYTENKTVNCPYLLDGLVFQPLEQEYITSVRDSKYLEYKWKPPQKNSVDFFIQFEKDKDSNKILTVYDNSVDEYVKNKPYRICNLYVGQKDKAGKGEQPTLFRKDEELYLAYLFLENGNVRDLEGNILQDNTVVEFYYNNDPTVDEKFRWVAIRTRNDKTESVRRYRRKYGNYIDVANKVWRSIINPIVVADFEELSKGDIAYEKKMTNLRSKISHELIVSAAKENAYYQLKTNLAKPMRQFHNWIKSIIIYTYCHPMYEHEKSLSILDIACGRGGDLMKFYYAKCAFYVGLDVDKEGLVSAVDGAESRYAQMRKTHPNFPEMSFIQADAGALLTYEDQNRVFGGMSGNNQKLLNKFFSSDQDKKVKFDRINCQFAMHYFLKNDETWRNFKANLNNHLKNGGYFLITVFDAERIVELLKGTDTYTINYTNQKGDKKILFELKRYQEFTERPFKPGNALDLHASWMFREGQYATEYLVDKDFIVKDLDKDCDLELVSTDLFDNQYEIHKEYFMNYVKYEENPETRQFLQKVAGFYEHNEINGGCFKYTRLERYYVFRKRDHVIKTQTSKSDKVKPKQSRTIIKETKTTKKTTKTKKTQKGGTVPLKELITKDNSMIPKLTSKDYTYCESLLHVLKTHELIPQSVKIEEFMEDFGLNEPDDKLDNEKIEKINKNIVIEHEISDGLNSVDVVRKEMKLSGLRTILLEQDCNGMYDVDLLNDSQNKLCKTVVMVREGNKYTPIYRKNKSTQTGQKEVKGLFDSDDDDDDFIKSLKNN